MVKMRGERRCAYVGASRANSQPAPGLGACPTPAPRAPSHPHLMSTPKPVLPCRACGVPCALLPPLPPPLAQGRPEPGRAGVEG